MADWCQVRVSDGSIKIGAGEFFQVELRGLEPLTPCLQIAVIVRVVQLELGG